MVTYPHFKGDALTRSEKIQRRVVQLVLETPLADAQRESSAVWELKHSSSCAQIGRLLAQKRGLDVELAEIACVLHDVASIVNGAYAQHGPKGAVIARELLEASGDFSKDEIELVVRAIQHHSEKDVDSKDAFVELVKDADVLDCSLYQGAENIYEAHKARGVFPAYVQRVQCARKELGLNAEPAFRA